MKHDQQIAVPADLARVILCDLWNAKGRGITTLAVGKQSLLDVDWQDPREVTPTEIIEGIEQGWIRTDARWGTPEPWLLTLMIASIGPVKS